MKKILITACFLMFNFYASASQNPNFETNAHSNGELDQHRIQIPIERVGYWNEFLEKTNFVSKEFTNFLTTYYSIKRSIQDYTYEKNEQNRKLEAIFSIMYLVSQSYIQYLNSASNFQQLIQENVYIATIEDQLKQLSDKSYDCAGEIIHNDIKIHDIFLEDNTP